MTRRPPDAMRGPGSMRRANEWAVLHLLYERDTASAPQLAADTGLSRPTVNLALANLQEAGLIRQSGVRAGRAGRAPRLWEPHPDAGRVVAVDIGVRWTRLLLADLAGNVLARRRERSRISDASCLVRQLAGLVGRLLSEEGTRAADVLSLVIGSPGYFDPAEQRVRSASNLPGWERPEMVALLTGELGDLGDRVVFENDIDLAAVGEQAAGLGPDVGDFAYLHIGSGIGMGTVIGGRLHRGAHGAAGEVAFLPIGEIGARTRERGALETAAAADGIVSAARREGLREATTAADVIEAARSGRKPALRALEAELDMLARALLSVTAVVDPERVVLGGGVGAHAEFLLEGLRERLVALSPLPVPELAVSAVGEEATLLGGLAHGTREARERAYARYAEEQHAGAR
jgi:predicted NBD/HSP70 family sugar kinase/biotin operon repressor